MFLDGPEAEVIARDLAAQHRDQHLAGRFLWSLWQEIHSGLHNDPMRACGMRLAARG